MKLFPHFVPIQTAGVTKADMPERPAKIGGFRGRIQGRRNCGAVRIDEGATAAWGLTILLSLNT